ncbi:MAG: TrkA family potassium uptake protein [Chloroflexi bacterium]|nr:TrkA family potassium uptake protein [Chloroflexota bacterium]
MKKQVCVIGLGRFGATLAQELYQSGHDVLTIDVDEAKVQDQLGRATYSVRADATNESILKELDVAEYDVCIVCLGSDNIQASILVSVLLKSLGVPFIIARAANELHGSTLERIGVDRVVYPEAESARRTAHVGFDTGVIDYMSIVPDFGISKLRPPEEMLGHTLEEAGLAGSADRHGISVLAIRRGRTSFLHPAKDEEIKAGDVLIVAATNEHLGKISEIARHLEPASSEAHTHRNSS